MHSMKSIRRLVLLTKICSLSNWYNTTTNIDKQEKVEAWIRERHPDIWAQMEALGHWVTMDGFGYKQFNIDRHLAP